MAAVAGVLARRAAALPPAVGRRLGVVVGELAYHALGSRRRVALENLALAFGPAWGRERRRAVARASFRHLGLTAVECCQLYAGSAGRLLAGVRLEGIQHLKAALGEGRGVLYLTAHFGNWELLGAAHVLTGFPLSVVARPLDNPFLEARLAEARRRLRMGLISKREAVPRVREALARGECVGVLLDQDAGRRGVFVPFFGQPASTSRALAILAARTRAPVVPAFIRRLPDGAHLVTLEPPVPLERSGDRERDIRTNTARFTAAIERQVRACPEQWFWVHRRWKTRPG